MTDRYWVTRVDPEEEVATAATADAGRYAMRVMLENAEEDGPLYLYGPDLAMPERAEMTEMGVVIHGVQGFAGF